MEGIIHSFESFGTVDGPGVRFVIFMQGCTMRCLYCHNPDTWSMNDGKRYDHKEVIQEILKYRNYIERGGVTLTGGEPLLQIDFAIALFTELKTLGIHTCMDTSGIAYDETNVEWMGKLSQLMKVCDLFLLDMKHIRDDLHHVLTGQSNVRPLAFAQYLEKQKKPIWIRHVLLSGYTDEDVYLYELRSFLDQLTYIEKIEVLPYHTMGEVKYQNLQVPYALQGVQPPIESRVRNAEAILGCDRYG